MSAERGQEHGKVSIPEQCRLVQEHGSPDRVGLWRVTADDGDGPEWKTTAEGLLVWAFEQPLSLPAAATAFALVKPGGGGEAVESSLSFTSAEPRSEIDARGELSIRAITEPFDLDSITKAELVALDGTEPEGFPIEALDKGNVSGIEHGAQRSLAHEIDVVNGGRTLYGFALYVGYARHPEASGQPADSFEFVTALDGSARVEVLVV